MSIDTNFVRVKGIVRDDPTLSEVDGIGTVAKFRVGVYRSGSKKNDNIKYDDFFVSAWHDLARGIKEEIKEKDWVDVTGSILTNSKKNDDGSYTNFYTISAISVAKEVAAIKKDHNEEMPF